MKKSTTPAPIQSTKQYVLTVKKAIKMKRDRNDIPVDWKKPGKEMTLDQAQFNKLVLGESISFTVLVGYGEIAGGSYKLSDFAPTVKVITTEAVETPVSKLRPAKLWKVGKQSLPNGFYESRGFTHASVQGGKLTVVHNGSPNSTFAGVDASLKRMLLPSIESLRKQFEVLEEHGFLDYSWTIVFDLKKAKK